jgi:hypothetical protein
VTSIWVAAARGGKEALKHLKEMMRIIFDVKNAAVLLPIN